ncbi:hypothetical protein ACOSQ3_004847 [Xanthoceras sorbifolium]
MNQAILANAGWRILQQDQCVWCNLLKDGDLVMVILSYFGLIFGLTIWGPCLSVGLPWQVVHKIVGIYISSNVNANDRIIWGCSGQGVFTVKSAYNVLLLEEDFLWKWRFIWHMKLSFKIYTFLWSLLHEKILTNKQRVIRGLAIDEICPRCCVGVEDLDHLLRGCAVSFSFSFLGSALLCNKKKM